MLIRVLVIALVLMCMAPSFPVPGPGRAQYGGGGGVAGFATNGVENQCTALGSSCHFSEPLNNNDAPSVPNTTLSGSNWNPSDTLSASTKECTDLNIGCYNTDTTGSQSRYQTATLASFDGGAAESALPSGHASNLDYSFQMNRVGGQTVLWFTIGNDKPPSGIERYCARYYYTVDDLWGGVNGTGARNKMMEMTGEQTNGIPAYMQIQENNACTADPSGPSVDPHRKYCPLIMAVNVLDSYPFSDGSGTHTYDDCVYTGGRGKCSGDSSYMCRSDSECSAAGKGTCLNIPPPSWCMIEACAACPGGNLDVTGGSACYFESWHRILAQGREAHIKSPTLTVKQWGSNGNYNFFGFDLAHDLSSGTGLFNLLMGASYTTDSGQRIGCAEEIEGVGCHASD